MEESGYATASQRALSQSNVARPSIGRLISLRVLLCPSTCPFLHAYVTAAVTAAASCRRPVAQLRSAGTARCSTLSHHVSSPPACRSRRIRSPACDSARPSLISVLMIHRGVMHAAGSGVRASGRCSTQNVARRTDGVLHVLSACINCARCSGVSAFQRWPHRALDRRTRRDVPHSPWGTIACQSCMGCFHPALQR
jgi:hypothetical protein